MTQPAGGKPPERIDLGEDQGTIEGGFVGPLQEYPTRPFHAAQHRAQTARLLAVFLLGILAASFVFHYVAIAIFEYLGKSTASDRFGEAFNSWLPVVSGLASAAVTFYFTRERSE